jgi:hypothetical protein
VNSSAATTTARAVAIALIIAVAAVAGLAVGNALQDRLGVSSSQTGFSLEALQDLQQLRGDNAPAAAAADDSSDYGIRHAVRAPAYVDYGVRHAIAPVMTDTFRLTGPSRVGATAKAQAFTDTFRLTGPSQLDDGADGPTNFGPPGR